MSNITLRRASEADTQAVSDCITHAYSIYATQTPDLPDVSGGIAEHIAEDLVWIASLEGRVLGVMILVALDTHVKLANIAVDPSAKGQGIGRMLIDRAETEAKRLGLPEIHLTTHVEMANNIQLYAHLGWVLAERDGNRQHMIKSLLH